MKIPQNIINTIKKEMTLLLDMFLSYSLLNQSIEKPPLIISIESTRISFPLSFQQASSYISKNIVLIGDSAHSIHPQAGQGLNLGIINK